MSDQLTPTERNALKWVLFKEWYDKNSGQSAAALGLALQVRMEILDYD